MSHSIFVSQIRNGAYDADLNAINDAVTWRLAVTMKTGTRIQITHGVSPKYLVGLTGIVSHRTEKRTYMTPDPDNPLTARAERFIHPDGTIRVPNGCYVVVP